MHVWNIRRWRHLLWMAPVAFLFSSCSISHRMQKMAQKELFNDTVLANGHTGITIVDAGSGRSLYDYQGDKYFVPASNTKIITLYTGLKYLGDSLPGLGYDDTPDTVYVTATGDPSFLHPDFSGQPVFDFLKQQSKPVAMTDYNWKSDAWGDGWMWNDYSSGYMAERSPFPVYGNVIRWIQVRDSGSISALAHKESFIYSEPDINWKVSFSEDTGAVRFSAERAFTENRFFITQGKEPYAAIDVPFITNGFVSALDLLKDSLGKAVELTTTRVPPKRMVRSQPADSLFRPMMHRSDNFFAEQTLLMASNVKLGVMSDSRMIDYMLGNDLKDLPQKPRWADGSGLSRYNLFTPRDFVWILQKMKNEYGMERLKNIFATGGTGTLANYYRKDSTYIYAKTGSLSGVICISGYLYGKTGKLMIFSVLVNNDRQPAWMIRRKTEAFLEKVRDLN